ncbi:MAG: ISL3 family transposase [Verrucomicrobiota bacterium]|nr:ISL3 family transposase [Verrucomicrobiota bacterium]
MRIETLLNHVAKFKSFLFVDVELLKEPEVMSTTLMVRIEPRKNGRPVCSQCGRPGTIYDHQPEPRYFEFIPLWNIPVQFEYRMRRVNCPHCGVKVEAVPWANGKSPIVNQFATFLANWAKRMSWSETADAFRTSWNTVAQAVKQTVDYGLEHRDLSGITAIGVDEVQYKGGQNYVTLVYQINQCQRRLIFVGLERKAKTLLEFFLEFGKERTQNIEVVCSDMWQGYISAIKMKAPQALHILDRFHIVQMLGKAIDKIRNQEIKDLQSKGFETDILKHTKYCFLKNEENLTEKQRLRLDDVLKYDLKSVRAYLLKESFQLFWNYKTPYWAEWYLDKWCVRANLSRLEPIKTFVRTIKKHQPLIMNWFRAKKEFNSGIVEGLNRRVNLVTRKSFGFKSYENLRYALFLNLGRLPEPEYAHRFF